MLRLCRHLLIALLLSFAADNPARAVTVADPNTGAALFGYDPVAYLLERKARLGNRRIIVERDGVVWMFASEANRQAFLADPASFQPAYGGHDGAGVARGVTVAGDPEIFAIMDAQVVLFRDEAERAAFLAEPGRREKAAQYWQKLGPRADS